MAVEFFTVGFTASRTVYFRFFDPSNDKVFDFDDDTWEVNLVACTDPKLTTVENTDMGDADESLYIGSFELATFYNLAPAKSIVCQAVDDLGTDEVISEIELVIASGLRINK